MSVDGTYRVQVEVGGKVHAATVELMSLDDMLWVTATDVPVVGKVEANGAVYPDDTFSVAGKLSVLFKRITYTIKGQVEGSNLSATCDSNMGTFSATGTRIS